MTVKLRQAKLMTTSATHSTPTEHDPCTLHPHSYDVPAASDAEYTALRQDIAEDGLHHPLEVTSAGLVLDGRARLRAVLELQHPTVSVVLVEPEDEIAYALRAALIRRQLSPSQRAALAALLAEVTDAQHAARERSLANLSKSVDVETLPARGERTRDLVAKLSGASARTAQDVLTVREHDPALFERVLRNEVSASTAASKVRRAQRDAAIPPPPPLPEGPFELILADPPWTFGSPDSEFAPEQHYPTMSMQQLRELELPATDDCVLFLWAVNALLPDALGLLTTWGFTYKSNAAWIKNGIGPGVWLRQQHELLLIATKGNVSPADPQERCSSVIKEPRTRHSEKPEASYQLIEQMYPQHSKLELFARGTPRPGWTIWGNQADPDDTEARPA
jgi:N6-adenosine-specific RNA methylase IME4/ParB-like chromosome segregation protein Spo0J